jgi:acyl-CoA dehydrogenase family protein 9
VCKTLLRLAIERVGERRAFGRNIGEFGLIKDKIARMLAQTYALECMTYLTAGLVDSKIADYSLESAICKVKGSEILWDVVNETLQIAAGIGYMQEYPYERMLRDSRIQLIFEGTNEILRTFVALSGMTGPREMLKDTRRALRAPIRQFGALSELAFHRAKDALGRERFTKAHSVLDKQAAVVDRFVTELTHASERALRKHGRHIDEMQFTQRRLAEIAIDLYALSAVIARTSRAIERRGIEGARRELSLAEIAASQNRSFADLRQALENKLIENKVLGPSPPRLEGPP